MCYKPANPNIVSIRTHASGANLAFKVIVRSPLDIFPTRTVFWYIFKELMLHDALIKLLGSMILSAHVPGQPEVSYELPAQSPQNVISKMTEWFAKNIRGLQLVGDNCAAGSFQVDGFGDSPFVIS